jgi:hypothetical protein
METIEYHIIQVGFVMLTLVCLVLFFIGLQRGLRTSHYTVEKRGKILTLSIIMVGVWIIMVGSFSLAGVTVDFSVFPPPLAFFLFPPLIVAIYMVLSGKLDHILREIPASWLVYFQSFRIVVEILLWRLFVIDIIPVQMTFEGRNFDVLAGAAGLVTGYLYSKDKLPKILINIYNIFGLITLINIVLIAILSMPTPLRAFMNEPANTVVGFFPIVYLPTLLVPFAYWFHFFSLRKVYIEKKVKTKLVPS